MIMQSKKYIVIGSKPWNKRIYDEIISKYPGEWFFFNALESLTEKILHDLNPKYIFFLHWSTQVPEHITNSFECVCFHMTDVPYGRGGSPLQNLIIRGHTTTRLSALRMVHDFDAGPVYLKRDLSLFGNAEEIYIRATYLSAEIILEIIQNEPIPVPQEGEPVIFRRRTPAQSEISDISSLMALNDFIRMLDADGYPHAYLNYRGFRFEFTGTSLYDNRIVSQVVITRKEEKK